MEIVSVKKSTSKIKRVRPIGKSTSYDFTVKDTHRILANGFYTSNCSHPEIETFINIKRDLKKVTGANISIRLTDDFMLAVKNDTDFTLQWPVDVPVEQAVITKVVRAKHIWDQIIDAAWTSAEPGLLFWDTVKRRTPTEAYVSLGYGNVSTNPCAELVLSPYDSCRLLLINLYKFVKNPFSSAASYDNVRFKDVAQKAQRLMDDLVDLEIEAVDKILAKIEKDPESDNVKRAELELWTKIKIAASGGRRTGLGITALGDTVAAMGFVYGSKNSIELTESLYKSLCLSAYRSTITMAKERTPFPVFSYDLEKDHPFIQQILQAEPDILTDYKKHGRRNIALTTTAPAGCLEKDAVLKTDHGDMTIEMFFNKNGIDIQQLSSYQNVWFNAKTKMKVMDINGDYQEVSKLYWNGLVDSKEFTLSSEEKIKTSLTHKFLVKVSDTHAKWVPASELKVGDKILSK